MTHEEMERKKRAILQSLAEGARAESAAPDEDDEEDGDIFVSTVTEAIALLLMHKEPGGARYRRRLIRFITDPKHQVYDSPNIYHNFVMHLFKLRDYIAALEVCDFVLRFAPQSRDILGDAIRACGESCQFERGERYLARAMEIPKELWCWRLFCYSVDFLKEKMIAYPADMAVAERDSFGAEAIDEIIVGLENDPGTVVIFAGYPEKMEQFLDANPGLRSRIPYRVRFCDYTADELLEISGKIAADNGFTITADAGEKLLGIFEKERQVRDFGNGRFCRSLVESAIRRKSVRLGVMDADDLSAYLDPARYSDEELFSLDGNCFTYSAAGEDRAARRIGFSG